METFDKHKIPLDEKKKLVLEALRECMGVITYACTKSGVVKPTQFYEWRNTDPKFAMGVREIVEECTDKVEGKLLKCINDNNIAAIIFYLKAKGRKRGYK